MSTSKTVLLTLGRLPVALDVARAFDQAGWRVVVADPWGMHLLKMSRSVARCYVTDSPRAGPASYIEQLIRIADEESVDLIVPVSEESVYVAALRDKALPVFSKSHQETLDLHDKYRFIELAGQLGLPAPRSALAGDATALTEMTPFVSKPRFSCSGRGVAFHAAGDSVSSDRRVVLQETLSGDAQSAFCVARDGVLSAHAVYRPTLRDGSVGIAFERVSDCAALMDWVEVFVRETGHTGFISFDFFVDEHGRALPIECNPRATSGIHFIAPETLFESIVGSRQFDASRAYRDTRLKESYSCFTRLLASVFSPHRFRQIAAIMRASRDVTWRREDPWPFLLMMVNSSRIVWSAMTSDHSFASAAIADVEWRPDDMP